MKRLASIFAFGFLLIAVSACDSNNDGKICTEVSEGKEVITEETAKTPGN